MNESIEWGEYTLRVEDIRKGDRILVNGNWHEVVESYMGSVHGPKYSGTWHLEYVKEYAEKVPNDSYMEYGGEQMVWREEDKIPVFRHFDYTYRTRIDDHNKAVWLKPNGMPYRWFVNVYEVDRSYGGPEEGGWWFDTGTILRIIPCDSWDSAHEVAEQFMEIFPRNGKSNSVIYNGGDYSVLVEYSPGKDYPDEFPRYC